MASSQQFCPDWASAPGETISEILAERGVSIEQFAEQIGHTREGVMKLLRGQESITIATARRLGQVLGASTEFWMSRDFQYQEDTARLQVAEAQWLADLPVKEMVKFGWLPAAPKPQELIASCLNFFGVPTFRAWRQVYVDLQELVAFRTSPSFDSRPAAVAAWLRQGEIESERIECKPWNAAQFEASLGYIRTLTRERDPQRFLPELDRCCAESGVAVVVVQAPAGCRASGATRFITPSKALILLSFRYLTDDHFWFTFFHEAGHVLLHGERSLFLEGVGIPSTAQEQEANLFAARMLVPPEHEDALLRLPVDGREVIRFARRIGISPGIVVGQLQHRKRLRHNQLNNLKNRYQWHEGG